MSPQPTGVHFVGSIPLPSTTDTLHLLSNALPHHITRLPDGEPAHRGNFIAFQCQLFPPRLLNRYFTQTPATNNNFAIDPTLTPDEINTLENLQTGYDTAALESYKEFSRLKKQGVVPQHVRFQVCLPTPTNVVANIEPTLQGVVEGYYTAALRRALVEIQDGEVECEELAVQIDMAVDFALIERDQGGSGVGDGGVGKAWFGDVVDGVVERAVGLVRNEGRDLIRRDVELGFHFCYGDLGHRHFVEPGDLRWVARVMRGVMEGCVRCDAEGREGRGVGFVHFPVPKERCLDIEDAEDYLGPLEREGCLRLWKEQGTDVYFGCVKEGDEVGTRKRVEVIGEWLENRVDGKGVRWGVATECGLGRTRLEDMDEILRVMGEVSAPVRTV